MRTITLLFILVISNSAFADSAKELLRDIKPVAETFYPDYLVPSSHDYFKVFAELHEMTNEVLTQEICYTYPIAAFSNPPSGRRALRLWTNSSKEQLRLILDNCRNLVNWSEEVTRYLDSHLVETKKRQQKMLATLNNIANRFNILGSRTNTSNADVVSDLTKVATIYELLLKHDDYGTKDINALIANVGGITFSDHNIYNNENYSVSELVSGISLMRSNMNKLDSDLRNFHSVYSGYIQSLDERSMDYKRSLDQI